MTAPMLDAVRTHVRAYTESNMDGRVTILRGQRGALDPATGLVSGMANPQTVYTGKARLHPVSSQGSIAYGAVGEVGMRQLVVSIPWASPMPQRDDVILVDDGGADPDMTGQALRVVSVDGGGLIGDARRMSCTLWGPSEYWTGTGQGAAP